MTAPFEAVAQDAAVRATPELARKLATALAADIEGDQAAVQRFVTWAAETTPRVHALAILAVVALGAAGWGPDDLRHFAAAQQARTRKALS